MSKAQCPGQDTRYWRAGDIFNIPCSNCGKKVEFFKDDVSRKCPDCGHCIQNPKISLGCAQWCEHAKECLGYDPKEALSEFESDMNDISLTKIILNELESRYGKDSGIYKNAENSMELALTQLKGETADPRVVLAAAMLLEVYLLNDRAGEAGNKKSSVKEILSAAALDKNTIEDIIELIKAAAGDEKIDTPEYSIVEECRKSAGSRLIN